MTIATRPFTIFVDDAPTRPKIKKYSTSARTDSLTPLSATALNVSAPASSLATSSDKENLHPITSARLGLDALKQKVKDGKDGKTKNALATKLLLAKPERIEKDKPDMKKRRLVSASRIPTRPQSTLARRDDKSKSGLVRKTTETTGVKEAKVKDAREVEAVDKRKVKGPSVKTQTEIDAKCYDLTVLPLADVSKAFEKVVAGDRPVPKKPSSEACIKSENATAEAHPVNITTRDPSSLLPAPLPSVAAISAALEMDKGPAKIFSTPERKEIYAAFTFTSPSPSAKRFAAARGNGSAFAFGDLPFNPRW